MEKRFNLKTTRITTKQTHIDVETGKKFSVKQRIPYYFYKRSNLTTVRSSISDVSHYKKGKKEKKKEKRK